MPTPMRDVRSESRHSDNRCGCGRIYFDNQSEVEQETDTEEETVSTVRIRPRTILFIVAGILLAAGLIFAGKKFYDNYYIIRHNREVRRNRKEQFRQMKSKSRRRRRHRR